MGSIRVERIGETPLVDARTDSRLDGNVTGPSLVRAPPWVDAPMGRYYLYFAHHEGDRIRLATANALTGPWMLHVPGALTLAASHFPAIRPRDEDLDPRVRAAVTAGADGTYPHIASPDVHVDRDSRTVRLYYHGRHVDGTQRTPIALSACMDADPQWFDPPVATISSRRSRIRGEVPMRILGILSSVLCAPASWAGA